MKSLRIGLIAVLILAIGGILTMQSCKKKKLIVSADTQQVKYNVLKQITGKLFHFEIKIKKPSTECKSGWGLCEGHMWIFGFQLFSVLNPPSQPDGPNGGNHANAEIDFKNSKLRLDILADSLLINEYDGIFEVGESIELPAIISQELGANSIQLAGGNYPLSIVDDFIYRVEIDAEID